MVKFWNWKFATALAVMVLFLLVGLPLGSNPETGESRPLLPKLTGSGPASFVFLLALLYVLSHAGGWMLAVFRHTEAPEPPPRGRPKRRKK